MVNYISQMLGFKIRLKFREIEHNWLAKRDEMASHLQA